MKLETNKRRMLNSLIFNQLSTVDHQIWGGDFSREVMLDLWECFAMCFDSHCTLANRAMRLLADMVPPEDFDANEMALWKQVARGMIRRSKGFDDLDPQRERLERILARRYCTKLYTNTESSSALPS